MISLVQGEVNGKAVNIDRSFAMLLRTMAVLCTGILSKDEILSYPGGKTPPAMHVIVSIDSIILVVSMPASAPRWRNRVTNFFTTHQWRRTEYS